MTQKRKKYLFRAMKVRPRNIMSKDSSSEKLVRYKGFLLQRKHLERLLDIQRQRRDIDPHMRKPAIGKFTR